MIYDVEVGKDTWIRHHDQLLRRLAEPATHKRYLSLCSSSDTFNLPHVPPPRSQVIDQVMFPSPTARSKMKYSRLQIGSTSKTCQVEVLFTEEDVTPTPGYARPPVRSHLCNYWLTRFDHVHIDIVGPLPLSNGFSYLLTCVDHFCRWQDAFPMRDLAAETVARIFTERWIATFGVPSTITTDRGTQFESQLFSELTKLLGTNRIRTTAYHPQANGLVECFHRQLEAALAAHCTLPRSLQGLNNTTTIDQFIAKHFAAFTYLKARRRLKDESLFHRNIYIIPNNQKI
ncbi:unnamed protein product [Hymenolepis diminuta]|uniref:Integrase catalytic domain-containing protein n=1 Tax=Hymenolepis diminuta TaxID=6216 RepID=A0A564ZAW8_HYMDI|nr:unnamed protein product [Hymenolepis diminuta]